MRWPWRAWRRGDRGPPGEVVRCGPSSVSFERFQRGNNLLQIGEDPTVVVRQALAPGRLGRVEEFLGGLGLATVDGKKLHRRLKVGASETGVGVGTLLARRPAAVAIGQTVSRTTQIVLEPLGVGRDGLGVKAEETSLHVDPTLTVALHLLAP